MEHQDVPLPALEDILPDEETVSRLMGKAQSVFEERESRTVYQRLGANLPNMPPEPLAGSPLAAQNWFDLMAVIGEFKEGATARQIAKRIGHERFLPSLSRVLEVLAARGELKRSAKGAVRYHLKPMSRVLPHLLRQFSQRLPGAEREAFDLAVLTYQVEPGPEAWRGLVEALCALVRAIPGWPEAIAAEVEADPVEWLRLAAGVEPPAYRVQDQDPLVSELRGELQRLQAAHEALQARLDQALADLAAERQRAAGLEDENAALKEAAEAWFATFERPTLEDFLAGRGRGELPDDLAEEEVARVRELVLATKANRKDQLAIAAGLAEVYRNPTGHQRLTTLSFKEHPYDSLWRARVGKYRIVYGVLHHVPHPIVIGTRGEVYEQTVHALRHKSL